MLKAQRKSSCGEKLKGLKGWGEYVVKEKLEGLKRKLKDWSKNVSCVEKSHFVLEKELNDLDKKEKVVGLASKIWSFEYARAEIATLQRYGAGAA